MLINNMKKFLPNVFAIGSAVACLVMVTFEVLYMHVPTLAWAAFSVCMLAYVIAENSRKKVEQEHITAG